MSNHVCLTWVHTGMVHEPFARSVAEACMWTPNRILNISTTGSPRQEASRNAAIKAFLGETECDWLMWVDTDMVFERDAIATLLDTAEREQAAMVTGLAFIWNPQTNEILPNGYKWRPDLKAYKTIKDYQSGAVLEIDGTGTGFLLVHRDVFEAWGSELWHETWPEHPDTGALMGHDLAFCHKSVGELGFKLVWDTSVKTGHIKSFQLTEDNYNRSK